MLAALALTPGTLDPTSYSSPEAFGLGVGCLDDLCRNEGLFLDLRAGNWSRSVEARGDRAKRFLTFARKENRLVRTEAELPAEPEEEEEWLWEAQAVDQRAPCALIIICRDLAQQYADGNKIVSAEALNGCPWWQRRSPSLTVERETGAYTAALRPILRHANSLMFIDPHIDPRQPNYREFISLLLAAADRPDHPLIEIHRASWRKEGGQKQVQSLAAWKADFKSWDERLEKSGLAVEVFLWEEVHNRYLISDMVGISVPNGFDAQPGRTDTLGRLGREERDRLQFEYDRANSLHRLAGSFEIGKVNQPLNPVLPAKQ